MSWEKRRRPRRLRRCASRGKYGPIKGNTWCGNLAVRLARVDLPTALAIAKEFPATGINSEASIVANIAFRLAADNPAESERVLSLMPQEAGRDRFPPAIAWRMAAVDPALAAGSPIKCSETWTTRTAISSLRWVSSRATRRPRAEAFQTAMQGFDRLMKEDAEYSDMLRAREVLLPMVEQIDPNLVPEYFCGLSPRDPPSVIPGPSTCFRPLG